MFEVAENDPGMADKWIGKSERVANKSQLMS